MAIPYVRPIRTSTWHPKTKSAESQSTKILKGGGGCPRRHLSASFSITYSHSTMVTTRRAAEEVIKPWKLPKHTNYLLHNANVIDPVNGRTFSEIDVKLKDGIIESVMPTKHSSSLYDVTELPKEERREAWLSPAWLSMVRENWLSLQRQEGYTIIDCTGKFLCPGLIDCHVHLMTVPGEATLDALNNIPTDVSLLRQPWVANQMLERGFTTVRDCGGASLALKEAIAEGVIPGPRLFISGHGISQTGGNFPSFTSWETRELMRNRSRRRPQSPRRRLRHLWRTHQRPRPCCGRCSRMPESRA